MTHMNFAAIASAAIILVTMVGLFAITRVNKRHRDYVRERHELYRQQQDERQRESNARIERMDGLLRQLEESQQRREAAPFRARADLDKAALRQWAVAQFEIERMKRAGQRWLDD